MKERTITVIIRGRAMTAERRALIERLALVLVRAKKARRRELAGATRDRAEIRLQQDLELAMRRFRMDADAAFKAFAKAAR